MMENRKKTGLLIIASSILLLIIIILLFIKRNNQTVEEPIATTTTTVVGTLTESEPVMPTQTPGDKYRNPQNYDVSKEAPYEENSNDASQIASLFAVRLGSFSNESDYSNFTDLKIFMTPSMQGWVDKHVADLRSQSYSGEYYGITTNKLFAKVLSYDDKAGTAKIEVVTERREDRGATLGTPFEQKMTVDLVRNDSGWLVDNAVWQK